MIFSRNVILAGHIADLCCYRRVISKGYLLPVELVDEIFKKIELDTYSD